MLFKMSKVIVMKRILSLILSCIITISFLPTTMYAASVPSAPIISSYTAISSSSIKIKWASVSGAIKYRIDRRRSDESDYKTLTSSRTATDYTDTGLKAGRKYYYRVYAINSAGTSKRSATYQLYTMPDTPVISDVSRDNDTELTISWNEVSGATKYKIVYRRGDVEDYQTLTTNATGTSYTHKNLKSGSRYWYRVYAILEGDIGNEGDRVAKNISSEHSGTVGEFTEISRPNTWIDNDNTSHVNLSWNKTYGNNDYSYDIYRKSPTDSDFIKVARTKNLEYTDIGLTSGVIYTYKIVTVVTDTGTICTKSAPFFAGPKITKNIVLTPQSGTSMKISWDEPLSETELTYTIRKLVGGEYINYGTTIDTYYEDNGLTTGNTYNYYIQVRDNSGNFATSTFSNSAVLQILPTSISLNKTSVSINDGDIYKLYANITPDNSTNISQTWSSSDTSVATVSSDGTVTAKLKGSTIITVKTSNGKYAECIVNVVSCEHSYDSWITFLEPTCIQDGSRYRTCSKCKEIDSELIASTGHSYSDEWIIVKEPTCLSEGEEARLCTICNEQTDNRSIDRLTHVFSNDWILEKDPTCNEEGIKYRICSLCSITKDIQEIKKLQHNYQLIGTDIIENEASLTQISKYECECCGDSYEDKYVTVKDLSPALIVRADKEYIKAGDTFSVSISIKNNPGFAEFALFLEYDASAFVPLPSSGGRNYAVMGEMLGNNGTYFSSIISNDSKKVLSVSWNKEVLEIEPEDPTETDISTDGIIFSVDFQAKDSIAAGKYQFSVTYEDAMETAETIVGGGISDGLRNLLFPEVTSTSVNIYRDAVKGDIDQNGVLNISDVTYLARHLVGWKNYQSLTDMQFEAGNVFSYKNEQVPKLNSMDGTKMMQLILGYTPVEKTTADSTISIDSSSIINLFAESTEPEFIVGSVKGLPGEYVDVPIYIKNNSGLSGFKVSLNYDKKYLTPEGIIAGTMIEGRYQANVRNVGDENVTVETDLENINVCWYEPENISDDGILFAIRFLVSDTAPTNGIIPVELSYAENDICKVSDLDIVAVAPTIVQGSVQLTAETPSLQYEITDASAVSESGIKYESIPVNGDFNLKVYIQKLIEEYTPATVFAAAYDSNKRLVSLASKELTEEILNEEICSIYIDKSNISIFHIKIFIWDGNNTLKPLAVAYDMQ